MGGLTYGLPYGLTYGTYVVGRYSWFNHSWVHTILSIFVFIPVFMWGVGCGWLAGCTNVISRHGGIQVWRDGGGMGLLIAFVSVGWAGHAGKKSFKAKRPRK